MNDEKKIKNKIKLGIIIFLVVVLFLCSGYVLTKFVVDKIANTISKIGGSEREIVDGAQNYLNEKYNQEFEVKDTEKIIHSHEPIPYVTTKELIITFENDIKVVYSYSRKKYYDNYQSKEIIDDIYEEIWNPMIQKISPVYENITDITDNYSKFNNYEFSDELLKKTSDSFFHNYYTGDIKNYLHEEDVNINLPDGIFIISEDNNSYQERLDVFKNIIKEYFTYDFVHYTVLTNELYNAVSEYKSRLLHNSFGSESVKLDSTFGYCAYDGCWIKGYLASDNIDRYNYLKFIKLMDGLYVSNAQGPKEQKNIIFLEKGDILFKESITGSELQSMMDSKINPTDKYRFMINTDKPIYQIELSNNYKNKIKDNNYIYLVFKINKDELKMSRKNNLYLYGGEYNYSNLIAFGDMSEKYNDDLEYGYDEEADRFTLSKYDYIVVSISVKNLENQYFWIGDQTRVEK